MPLKGKSKKDVVLEFRHAEILEAARKIFAHSGFDEASVDAIAQAAGVAKGTVYLYYSSKREIYWEALKSGLDGLCLRLEREVNAACGAAPKISAFLVTKLRYFEENRDFFKTYYSEFGHAMAQPAYFHKDFIEYNSRQVRLLAGVLGDGIRSGEIRDLPVEAMAFAIVNLTRGTITHRLLGWTSSTIEDDVGFMFDLTWKGIAVR